MKHDNKLIIIGFADALSAPEVAWCLLDHGFHVTAFIRRKQKSILHKCKSISLFEVTAPEYDFNKTVSELSDIYESLQAEAIMPLNDMALWLCNKLNSQSEVVVAGPVGENAQFSLDKRIQIKAAINSGFNVPQTINIERIDDIIKIKNFPVVIKPALAIADSDGKLLKKEPVSFCVNNQELDRAVNSWDKKQPMLAQSIHKGVGEGLFGFATKDGIHAWSAHRRLRMMNPKGSGSSACKAISIQDHSVHGTEQMLLKANWRGMFMVELLRDDSNNIWFIELNGRAWGSMALALRMGFEYPAWTLMQTFDPTFIPKQPTPHKFITCRHLGREILHLLQVLRGPSSSAIPNWPSKWSTFCSLLSTNKDDQWYNLRTGHTAFFLEDTYKTVLNEIIKVLRRK